MSQWLNMMRDYWKIFLNKGYYNVNINSSFAKILSDQSFELIFNIQANSKLFFGDLKMDLPNDFSKSNYEEVEKFFTKLKNEPYSINRIEDIVEKIEIGEPPSNPDKIIKAYLGKNKPK